jgi:DNA-binding GntR family transcriptional regulator
MGQSVLRISESPVLLRDQAFERLRDAIITGHFAPGDRLIERELCEAMGVSRTSIREVLRRLEAEALVEVEPRRGPIVARLTRKQVAEIYEVRALLESAAVRLFTATATDEEIAKLHALYDALKTVRKDKNVVRIIQLTNGFVDHILRVVGNDLMLDMHNKLLARISLLRGMAISFPGRLDESAIELEEVMKAIGARDPLAASDRFSTYVLNAGKAALRRFD